MSQTCLIIYFVPYRVMIVIPDALSLSTRYIKRRQDQVLGIKREKRPSRTAGSNIAVMEPDCDMYLRSSIFNMLLLPDR